jgi:hypothetical protein
MLDYWNVGILEYWSIGSAEKKIWRNGDSGTQRSNDIFLPVTVSPHLPIRILIDHSSVSLSIFLYGILSAFARSDSDDLIHGQYENLPVADLSRLGTPLDGFNRLRNDFIRNDQFDLGLGEEVDLIFGASVDLGMAPLPSEALDLGRRHSLDADFGQGMLHFIQLKRFDNGFYLFHFASCISSK